MSKFAKKSLGQNFLHSTTIRQQILDEAGDIADKKTLEIGPGLGFLTTKLLQAKTDLTAIELDRRAIEILDRDFGKKNNFHLIQGSVLDENLDEIFGNEPYVVIANIPYHITAPILRRLFSETQNKPQWALLMIQKEVAQKLTNPQKNSILKLSVDIFAETKCCFEVGKENFNPVPKVDSAVIKCTTRKVPLLSEVMQKDFFTIINAGFSQKRKKLGNFIGPFFGVSSKELLGNIDSNRRAETLSIEEWISITRCFQETVRKF